MFVTSIQPDAGGGPCSKLPSTRPPDTELVVELDVTVLELDDELELLLPTEVELLDELLPDDVVELEELELLDELLTAVVELDELELLDELLTTVDELDDELELLEEPPCAGPR